MGGLGVWIEFSDDSLIHPWAIQGFTYTRNNSSSINQRFKKNLRFTKKICGSFKYEKTDKN